MAHHVQLDAGESVRIDDLCPLCFLPALVKIPFYALSSSGVTKVGTVTACVDCRNVISRVREAS